jgi:hypothetical protein
MLLAVKILHHVVRCKQKLGTQESRKETTVSRSPISVGDVLPLTLSVPTSRRHLYSFDLVIGDIDHDNSIEFFTCSKCHLFACGLHEETGYGLAVLRLSDSAGWHAGVVVGDEYFVDITGPRPIEDAINAFSSSNNNEQVNVEFYESDILSFYKSINDGAPIYDEDWWCNDGGFTFAAEFGGLVIGDVVRPFVSEFLDRYRWL